MPSAMMRATTSLGPPGGNGTIMLIVRVRIILRPRRQSGHDERGGRQQPDPNFTHVLLPPQSLLF